MRERMDHPDSKREIVQAAELLYPETQQQRTRSAQGAQRAPSIPTHQEPMVDVGGVIIELWRPDANEPSEWFMVHSISQCQWPASHFHLRDMQYELFLIRARKAGYHDENDIIQWDCDGEPKTISGLDNLSGAVYRHLTQGHTRALRLDITAKERPQPGMFYLRHVLQNPSLTWLS